jgi:transmembrane sensor
MSELRPPLKEHLRSQPTATEVSRMWASIRTRRERSGLHRWQVASLAAAAVIGVLGVGVYASTFGATDGPTLAGGHAPPQPRVTDAGPLRLQDGSMIASLRTAGAATETNLGDGSRILLAAHSELLPRGSTGSRVDFALTHGRVTLDVVPGGPRRWSIRAGDVEVSVLGTRFSVERGAEVVRVHVERGHVRVRGERVPGGARDLYAGQEAVVTERAAPPPTVIAPDAGTVSERHIPTRRSSGSAQELLAQADRARLAGKPQEAAAALQRVLDAHSDDPSASLAALTLGRLYLDQLGRPALAARALQRAGDLGLPQALKEEGAARLVEAHARAGHADLARAAAARYRAQHAGGRRSADVERWASSE